MSAPRPDASRRRRLSALRPVRVLFALSLVVALFGPVLGLLAICALAAVPMMEAIAGHGEIWLLTLCEYACLGAVTSLVVVVFVLVTPRHATDSPVSIRVDRADAPALWEAVATVAARLNTAPPDELRLDDSVNASVTEETRLLGLIGGTRRLTIGLPFLLGISGDELLAALAHEMGHYARGDTGFGVQIRRGSYSLRNIQAALRATAAPRHRHGIRRAIWFGPSRLIWFTAQVFGVYAPIYRRLSSAILRRQELEADQTAADEFGADAMVGALLAVVALRAAWDHFLDNELDPMAGAGKHPDDSFAAFAVMLDDPDFRDVMDRIRTSPPSTAASPLDTHPSLAVRLDRLRRQPASATGRERNVAPAAALVPDGHRRALAVALRERAVAGRAKPSVLPWREWVTAAARCAADEAATDVLAAASALAGSPAATLDTVLRLIDTGRADALSRALAEARAGARRRPSTAPDDPTSPSRLAAAVFALAGNHLVAAGRAQWVMAWTEPRRLVIADFATADLRELVGAAVTAPGANMSRLRLHLAELRVDPTVPVAVDDRSAHRNTSYRAPAPSAAAAAGSLAAVAARGRRFQLALGVTVASIGAVTLLGLWTTFVRSGPWSDAPPLGAAAAAGPGTAVYRPSLPAFTPDLIHSGIGRLCLMHDAPAPVLDPLVTVQPGDTLSRIAASHRTTVAELQQLNGLGVSAHIQVGQQLVVPESGTAGPPGVPCVPSTPQPAGGLQPPPG